MSQRVVLLPHPQAAQTHLRVRTRLIQRPSESCEQVFSDNDEDGDGKLAGPEVPQISTETRVRWIRTVMGFLPAKNGWPNLVPQEPASNEGESDQAEDGGSEASEENESLSHRRKASSEGGEATTSEEAAE